MITCPDFFFIRQANFYVKTYQENEVMSLCVTWTVESTNTRLFDSLNWKVEFILYFNLQNNLSVFCFNILFKFPNNNGVILFKIWQKMWKKYKSWLTARSGEFGSLYDTLPIYLVYYSFRRQHGNSTLLQKKNACVMSCEVRVKACHRLVNQVYFWHNFALIRRKYAKIYTDSKDAAVHLL